MQISINNFPITTRFHEVDTVHHTPHKGVDFALPMNTPVPCVGDGTVIHVMDEGNVSFGKSVWVQLNDGTTAVFGHLNGFAVEEGQHVGVGQIIGYSGTTGASTGPHLHLQVMRDGVPIDPTPYVTGQSGGGHSFAESVKGVYDFLCDMRTNGLIHAVTGRTMGEWIHVFDKWCVEQVDGVALMVGLFGGLFGLMGWKKGWKIVYWDVGIYIVLRTLQTTMGGS